MVARVVCAVVPFADEAGCVARTFQEFGYRQLAQGKTVESPRLERVDHSGAMRIAARHQRRARGRANGRRRIMLRQTDAVIDEVIERRRSRGAVVEASEVAVTHVVGDNQDDVWPGGHRPNW